MCKIQKKRNALKKKAIEHPEKKDEYLEEALLVLTDVLNKRLDTLKTTVSSLPIGGHHVK